MFDEPFFYRAFFCCCQTVFYCVAITFFRTRRNLHSHAEKAPLTTHHNQVTGYGDVSKLICHYAHDRAIIMVYCFRYA